MLSHCCLRRFALTGLLCSLAVPASGQETPPAGNEEVARIFREFPGRGDLGDGSPPLQPADSLAAMQVPGDLKIELIASEPDVAQPLQVSFDRRGRMWVVQYRQYPFPAGLKVVRYDQHLRAVFDKVPAAPPNHTPGADRITVWEDRDGDGSYESHRDVISGLNIATSVAVGSGGIWVLNPPYLLFYADEDRDAECDAEPVVHLSGFGLEDTHSVANSLMFGPDGWLYGVNGSTTTARVVTHLGNQPPLAYEGQCVWRYHPSRHEFEIFAEGGGNPFGLEMDATGQIFSGTNWGDTRGMHYPQGGYGIKNWGKHGPLTNPYAFGYFNHMPFSGDGRRFTEEFTIYDDDQLPTRYHGQMVAVNPLQRLVVASHLKRVGSSYRTDDFETFIDTTDRWFRPVDVTLGPDGALYFADWYDTRLTHVDPRDNWHKSSGRIYRVSARETDDAAASKFNDILPSRTKFDFAKLSTDALLRLLDHPNRWIRFAAVQEIVEHHPEADKPLQQIVDQPHDPRQLEALWCLARLQGPEMFIEVPDRLHRLLTAEDPAVRRWTIRLLGDLDTSGLPDLNDELLAVAVAEGDLQVRSQLASTAKRLPGKLGLDIALKMLSLDLTEDRGDPHIPLLLWWAVEAHVDHQAEHLAAVFESNAPLWDSEFVRQEVLQRLARRCLLVGDTTSYNLVTGLLKAAPNAPSRDALLRGVDAGLAERGEVELPPPLQAALERLSGASPHKALVLKLRQGDEQAIKQAITLVGAEKTSVRERIELIEILAQLRPANALDTLLGRLNDSSVAVRRAALSAVARYDDPKVGGRIVSAYQSSMDSRTGLRPIAVRVLTSRPAWAKSLIQEIDALKIPAELVTPDMVLQMHGHQDETLSADVERLWGRVQPTPEQKLAKIDQLRQLVSEPAGDWQQGKKVFMEHCGKCHRLFGEGGEVGPDLTGYERTNFDFLSLAIVDPSAAIREEYTSYQALTLDGQLLVGLLVNQTPQAITLRTAEGQTIRVDRDDLDELKASPVSLMPENLLEPLSSQQIQDLMRYLSR